MLKTAKEIVRPEVRFQASRLAPALFTAFHQLRNGKTSRTVRHETELVIEGFPRSANTYFTKGFLLAQEHDVPVAHHLHLPVNIIQGIKMRIPCLVLVRRPTEAVISLVALRMQQSGLSDKTQDTYTDRFLSRIMRDCARHWVRFYRTILPWKYGCQFVCFEKAVADPGREIERLNTNFGTDYRTHVPQSRLRKKLDHEHNALFSPSKERESAKQRLSQVATQGNARHFLQEAEKSFEQWFMT